MLDKEKAFGDRSVVGHGFLTAAETLELRQSGRTAWNRQLSTTANSVTSPRRLRPDPAGIEAAVEVLRAGGLVAFPTETVYGLGADAADARAVARLYAAKGRPSFNPLIAHVADIAAAERAAKFTP